MSKKSPITITKKDAFAVGKIQGQKEAFEEILELIKGYDLGLVGTNLITTYCNSRLRQLHVSTIKDVFKQKDGK